MLSRGLVNFRKQAGVCGSAVLVLLLLALSPTIADPLPGSGFSYSTYVDMTAGGMAMTPSGDLFVLDGAAIEKYPRALWPGVQGFIELDSSRDVLAANSGSAAFAGMASNSQGRVYGAWGCELNTATGIFDRCNIWDANYQGVVITVDPANDDLIVADVNNGAVARVKNPDLVSGLTQAQIIPLWDSATQYNFSVGTSTFSIFGLAIDAQGDIFIANAGGSVVILDNTGTMIKEVMTASLSMVPSSISVTAAGDIAVLGSEDGRMACLNATDNYSLRYIDDGNNEGFLMFSVVGADGCIYQGNLLTPSILRVTYENLLCNFYGAAVVPPNNNNPPSCAGDNGDCTVTTVSVSCERAHSSTSDGKCVSLDFSDTTSTC